MMLVSRVTLTDILYRSAHEREELVKPGKIGQ
jgi:hypothetical protein